MKIEAYEKEVEEALLNNNPLPDHSWMPSLVCKWGWYRVMGAAA